MDLGDIVDQSLGIWLLRVENNVIWRSTFHEFSAYHDEDQRHPDFDVQLDQHAQDGQAGTGIIFRRL